MFSYPDICACDVKRVGLEIIQFIFVQKILQDTGLSVVLC